VIIYLEDHISGLKNIMIEDNMVQDPNTPHMSLNKNFEDEAMVGPLRHEKVRDKIMPSPLLMNKEISKSREFLSPQLNGGGMFQIRRPSSAAIKTKKETVIERQREENKKDNKIMDLQMQVGTLRKENMELRLMMNYFMQLNLLD
jgi:hypothetical protein